MRGDEERQEAVFLLESLKDRVPVGHPLRKIRRLVDTALADLGHLFAQLYAEVGRPSIQPEYLLRAALLQKLYVFPLERGLCQHVEFNLLFRWFVGLPFSEAAWDCSTFSRNRERILTPEIFTAFFEAIRRQAESRRLLSKEHFSVDATLIEAAASINNSRPKEEPGAAVGHSKTNRNDGAETRAGPHSPHADAVYCLSRISRGPAPRSRPHHPERYRAPGCACMYD
ncbi:MAG: transposase [Gaiellales bacterium]|nr:transposase [Gaiellales bacterium]